MRRLAKNCLPCEALALTHNARKVNKFASAYKLDLDSYANKGDALTVFCSKDIEKTQSIVEKRVGKTVKPVFSFSEALRLHFAGPNGNECVVLSDTK